MAQDELLSAQPIVEGRLYFCALRHPAALRTSHLATTSICYCVDDQLLYEPFFADFGPLNLGKAYRYCKQTQELLQEADRSKKRVYFYCGPHAHQRANAAVLVGIYQVIFLNRSAEEAFKPLQAYKPYVPFRDASCGVSTFHLTVFDVIKGIQKARDVGFLDWNSGSSSWSLEEYEHYEQVENGDLNWIVPGKLVAFSGPAARGNEIAGYRLHTPEDYWDYYRKKGVTAVVRLNKKVYDRKRFTDGGFRHYDLYFPDGSCPTEAILLKWLEIAESEPGALAVHCKAGLGRTGVLICCYIMKHFKFTAEEVIGYIRVCRPGSVIGPQQNFLRDVEARMWHEGDMWRAQRGIHKPHLALGDLVINGRAAGSDSGHGELLGSPALSRVPSNSAGAWAGAAGSGYAAAYANGSHSSGSAFAASAGAPLRPQPPAAVRPESTASAASDLSLSQYAQMRYGNGNGLSISVPVSAVTGYSNGASSNGSSAASTPTATPTSRATPNTARYTPRSITPLRYAASANPAHSYGGMMASHPPAVMGTPGGSIIGAAYATRGLQPAVARSMPSMAGVNGRAPSADRAAERAAALRATIHTDTLRQADRPRGPLPERTAQSAEVGSGIGGSGWRINSSAGSGMGGVNGVSAVSQPIPTTPKAPVPGHRPGAGVARTLAPNGQPRKVPVALLPQYHAGLGSRGGMGSAAGAGIVSTAANGSLMTHAASDASVRVKSVVQMRYGLQSK